MTKSDIYNQYAVIIHGDDGKTYALHFSTGFHGTDTDEWSEYIQGVGKLVDRKRAFEIATSPNSVGYAKAPHGNLIVYKIELVPVSETIIRVGREVDLKAEALALLSDDHKRVLGIA